MKSPADLKPRTCPDERFAIREVTVPQWQLNKFLYYFVGEAWDWYTRRRWSDEEWQNYVAPPTRRTFLACYDGSIAGYFELERGEAGDVEIVYFGLTPQFVGRRLGGPMLTNAIQTAWEWGASRVWVHTCTKDHPAALPNYQARGLRVYDVRSTG
jgi:GNAT superfamily N-acetyltransferase